MITVLLTVHKSYIYLGVSKLKERYNFSGNKLKLPNNPDELQESVCHITHLVLNNMKGYTWSDLMTCCVMFPTLRKLQASFTFIEWRMSY